MKGNHAVVEGAIQAGCKYFFGYPITPQNEVPEYMSVRMPQTGGRFVQAESEVSAINMVLGAAAAGARVITSSSGPGIDLKWEGIGNLSAHRLPCVIVDVARGGPGNGALHPAQTDLANVTWGRGDLRLLVLAPWSVQEMMDHTRLAFELADRYRNPVMVLSDAVIGQMSEAISLSEDPIDEAPEKPWALTGAKGRPRNLTIAHFPEHDVYNKFHEDLKATYEKAARDEQRWEEYDTEDADLVLIAYGISARVCRAAVRQLRQENVKVGLLRPITLTSLPQERLEALQAQDSRFLVVEMSAGQLTRELRLLLPTFDFPFKPGSARALPPRIAEVMAWAKELL